MNPGHEIKKPAETAKMASFALAEAGAARKNEALKAVAAGLDKNRKSVMEANLKDVERAEHGKKSAAFIDRLKLDSARIDKMIESVLAVSRLDDPVGEVVAVRIRPNGLEISKVRTPIGVIAIIYESRPDVGAEAAALCLKSGNCVILRGGSDARSSNAEISGIMQEACVEQGLPRGCIQSVKDTSREGVKELLKLDRFIDLVMPRGGEGLIRMVAENSRIPVIKHYKGVCHVYVDSEADIEMAKRICFNAKVQRPGVCNAMETMLVHAGVADAFLKDMFPMLSRAGVEIRGDERSVSAGRGIKPAVSEDWDEEYLDLVLAVRVVDSMEEAIEHINRHGSKHSDAIVTNNYLKARRFLKLVDSAAVYVNASTRFTDGGEFGFGAEIGISTDKLHARGPMGLAELTSYKYVICGEGQIRE